MYYPVPGFNHVKVLAPNSPAQTSDNDTVPYSKSLSPLIRVALDAAFGIRDIRTLQERAFAPGVRKHVTARMRGGASRGPVMIRSVHTRPGEEGGETFGTATAGGERHAWAARIEEGRLVSFRVL